MVRVCAVFEQIEAESDDRPRYSPPLEVGAVRPVDLAGAAWRVESMELATHRSPFPLLGHHSELCVYPLRETFEQRIEAATILVR